MRRILLAVVAAVLALAFVPAAARAQDACDVPAPGAIVVEPSTGDVVCATAPDEPRAMASTTKLMTALLTLEQADLDDVVTTPRYQTTGAESVAGFGAGEEVTVADLLRALLVRSANDAAYALSRYVGGSEASFVRQMNRRAEQLGLENTSYANPIGLDEVGNYSTPRDLATLALRLRKNPFFRKTVDSATVTLESGARPRTLANTNRLLASVRWVDGVKTGFTADALDVLVSSGHKRGGEHMLAVVMGAADEDARDAQSRTLLEEAMKLYKLGTAVETGTRSEEEIAIEDRPGALLPVNYGRTVKRVIRKGEDFRYRVDVPDEVTGPIEAGERVGEASVFLRGERVAKVPMVAAIDVPGAGWARRTQDAITSPWTLVVLGGVLLLATLFTTRRGTTREPRSEAPA